MQFIVLDMEWNQSYPGSRAATKYPDLHGEIIQIGAVKLNPDMTPGEEFQKLVFPSFMPHLSKRVAKLTNISEEDLHEHGLPFPLVVKAFRKFCGEDFAILTWGYDDIPILRENLKLHKLDTAWAERWYNLQLIFNAQTDGSSSQKALSTAMEFYGIESSRPAHDALGDAYHTALLCGQLDMEKGIAEYGKSRSKAENDTSGIPDCLQRKVFRTYQTKEEAMKSMEGEYNLCPKCGKRMTPHSWVSQPGRRYMNLMTCPRHGEFLVRLRLDNEQDGGLRTVRLVYSSGSEAANNYRSRLNLPTPVERSSGQQGKTDLPLQSGEVKKRLPIEEKVPANEASENKKPTKKKRRRFFFFCKG